MERKFYVRLLALGLAFTMIATDVMPAMAQESVDTGQAV